MPTSDGVEICTRLLSVAYESLDDATAGVLEGAPLCNTILSLLQDVYASADFRGNHSLVRWRLQLCYHSRAVDCAERFEKWLSCQAACPSTL